MGVGAKDDANIREDGHPSVVVQSDVGHQPIAVWLGVGQM
jgi:hypothetical protein